MARRSIDLNSDLGEGFGPWVMGDDATMLSIVTSANVACGGHASDPETMYRTLVLARERGVAVGAHPGFADREGFGRRLIPMAPDQIGRMVAAQVGTLQAIARLAGAEVAYIKPHGALGNFAARDVAAAEAIAEVAAALGLPLLTISGTELEQAARRVPTPVYSEVFADRGYLRSGELVPRGQPGAMIEDPNAAADRLLHLLDKGEMPVTDGSPIRLSAQSICVHGDSPHAVAMARTLRKRLLANGVAIKRFLDG